MQNVRPNAGFPMRSWKFIKHMIMSESEAYCNGRVYEETGKNVRLGRVVYYPGMLGSKSGQDS